MKNKLEFTTEELHILESMQISGGAVDVPNAPYAVVLIICNNCCR